MCIGTGVTELLTDNVSTDLHPYYRQISTDLCKQCTYLKAYLSAKKQSNEQSNEYQTVNISDE